MWTAQSWLVLRQFREGLTLGTAARPGVINFAHSLIWRGMGARVGEFRVGVRADFPRVFDVDFEILQNPAVECGSCQAYLPLWPVPGQIERRATRCGVHTVAYAGFLGAHNLASAIVDGAWCTGSLRGLQFVVVPPNRWHDLSEIDLLVAIRSLDRRTYPGKPPSKLFNAWRAAIPLVGGYDSAFSAVGRPGKDYLRVGSAAEFGRAVVRLREDDRHYEAIVEEGRVRAAEVSHERLAARWLEVFDRQIVPAYERWLHNGGPARRRALARRIDRARDVVSGVKARLVSRSQ
jgi:hypothetical protein